MLADYPAFVRVYDLLAVDGKDLRGLPWTERRRQLEAFVPRLAASHFDLSPVIEAAHFDELAALRAGARDPAIEGVMQIGRADFRTPVNNAPLVCRLRLQTKKQTSKPRNNKLGR